MKMDRIVLCYPDMDRIILSKEKDLEKFDLTKVSAVEASVIMSLAEFAALREKFLLL